MEEYDAMRMNGLSFNQKYEEEKLREENSSDWERRKENEKQIKWNKVCLNLKVSITNWGGNDVLFIC